MAAARLVDRCFTALATLWWSLPAAAAGPLQPAVPRLHRERDDHHDPHRPGPLAAWAPPTGSPTSPASTTRPASRSSTTPFLAPRRRGDRRARLVGSALRGNPHQRFLVLGVLTGVALVGFGYAGELDGFFGGRPAELLDGALAPLRNLHKFDVVLRIPLVLGLAHAAGRAARPCSTAAAPGWRRGAVRRRYRAGARRAGSAVAHGQHRAARRGRDGPGRTGPQVADYLDEHRRRDASRSRSRPRRSASTPGATPTTTSCRGSPRARGRCATSSRSPSPATWSSSTRSPAIWSRATPATRFARVPGRQRRRPARGAQRPGPVRDRCARTRRTSQRAAAGLRASTWRSRSARRSVCRPYSRLPTTVDTGSSKAAACRIEVGSVDVYDVAGAATATSPGTRRRWRATPEARWTTTRRRDAARASCCWPLTPRRSVPAKPTARCSPTACAGGRRTSPRCGGTSRARCRPASDYVLVGPEHEHRVVDDPERWQTTEIWTGGVDVGDRELQRGLGRRPAAAADRRPRRRRARR